MTPLLCELHAHTTWSDGELSLRELVDLYGTTGFDVLCVTDHTHPAGDPWAHLGVRPERLPDYFVEIAAEAERAWSRYGLLLLRGLPCEQDEEAILSYLRSSARVHLTIFDPVEQQVAA